LLDVKGLHVFFRNRLKIIKKSEWEELNLGRTLIVEERIDSKKGKNSKRRVNRKLLRRHQHLVRAGLPRTIRPYQCRRHFFQSIARKKSAKATLGLTTIGTGIWAVPLGRTKWMEK
jgi:hypothetical protein